MNRKRAEIWGEEANKPTWNSVGSGKQTVNEQEEEREEARKHSNLQVVWDRSGRINDSRKYQADRWRMIWGVGVLPTLEVLEGRVGLNKSKKVLQVGEERKKEEDDNSEPGFGEFLKKEVAITMRTTENDRWGMEE